MVEELSPALSVFWAIGFLMFIVVTQKPLFAYFRGTGTTLPSCGTGYGTSTTGS